MVKVMASGVLGQSDAAEGPAGAWREEVAVRRTDVTGWGGATTSPEDVLADHELAVVFAHRAGCRPEARIRGVAARGPLPGVAEDPVVPQHGAWVRRPAREEVVAEKVRALAAGQRDGLPLGLGRQPHPGPVREGVGFVVAHMAHRLVGVDWSQARKRE